MTEATPPSHSPDPSPPAPRGSGLSSNVAGALSYLLGPLTGVFFLVVDSERPFVRFHAMQSILVSLVGAGVGIALMVADFVLGAIPILGWLASLLLNLVLGLAGFVLWLVLMYRAFEGEEWELPVVGEHARRLARHATGGG